MIREIKFRAWNVFEKEMDYEVTIDPNGKVSAFSPLDGQYVRGFSDSEMILMQYTGLKDRNGKEIYEGDIMKIPDLYETPENTEMTYHNRVIDFAHGGFRLGGFHVTEDYEYIQEECEVIGNRWSNPDLLVGGYE